MGSNVAERPETALIVEDNEAFRALLKGLLHARMPALTVMEAGTVADGLRKVRDHAPGLVLMDIQLPDGNGLSATRIIKDECPAACVIVCTSHDLPEYREAAFACGAAFFLPKDRLDPREMGELVCRLLCPAEV